MEVWYGAALCAEARQRSRGNEKLKIAAIHAGITAGVALMVTLLQLLLSQGIGNTGGLSGLGMRSLLQTAETVLSGANTVLMPFWNVGFLFAALLWGGLISLEFDTFITSTLYDMGLFYLSVDAMEFLVLLLILKLMQRKQKSKLTNQVWLLGTSSILFQTLAWGNLSYMNTAPDTKAPVPSIVIIILLLLSTAGTLMAVRRMLKEQKMLAQKEKLDQTSEHLDEQYVYLNQQKDAINRVRSTINDYKINFTEDLSVDTVHESTMDYLNEQYSDSIVLNTLLKYYGKKFDEQNIPHQFRILCSMRDVLPEDKIVIIFASLLDHISGSADLTLNTAKGMYQIELVTGSSSAGIMKHLASSLEQELDGFYPAVNITSGQNTNVSVIFQKGGSHEAQ